MVYEILIVVGLTGLVMMSIPGLGRHGHAAGGHAPGHGFGAHTGGHAGVHAVHGVHVHAPGHGGAHAQAHPGHGAQPDGRLASLAGRLTPSPRALFSFAALYGASGLALSRYLGEPATLLASVLVAAVVQQFVFTPIWNRLMRLAGTPASPLEMLVLEEAEAVTSFNNGRGMVKVVRDGRTVQFVAALLPEQAAIPVRVGDKLTIQDVDSKTEHLTVSVG